MQSNMPYDIEAHFQREFEVNSKLYTWECVDNQIDSIIGGNYINSSENQGIIIQGGLDYPKLIEFSIQRYVKCCPNAQIILSTWSDSQNELIVYFANWFKTNSNLHLLLNNKPEYFGGANTNLQIISTRSGIEYAKGCGCKFVLKHRTDMIFSDLRFLDTLSRLNNQFKEHVAESQIGRIIVGSTGTFKSRPFSVSDFFSYGHVEDMDLMWQLDLSSSDEDKRNVDLKPPSLKDKNPIKGPDVKLLKWSASDSKVGESYICSNLLKKSNYTYSHSWKDSRLFLASCFLIFDAHSLGLVWPKYGMTTSYYKYKSGHAWGDDFAKSTYGMQEISFVDWLDYYFELKEENKVTHAD